MLKRTPLPNYIVLLLMLTFVFFFAGCTGTNRNNSTIGDGKVDQVEAASIRVAVGLAFTARPDTVSAAYAASAAILALIGTEQADTVNLTVIDDVIDKEVARLGLDAATRLAFLDLVALVKAKTMEQLHAEDDLPTRLVVVRDVVKIINEAAEARMAIR